MKKNNLKAITILLAFTAIFFSCQKEFQEKELQEKLATISSSAAQPPFNMQVILRGEGKRFGHIKFRQDVDPAKIIVLDTWVRDLEPNREYLLQRAVDVNLDGNCTGTTWLTLGKGLTPQSILTDAAGTGSESLWRNISAIASGSAFDIHFRVVDKSNLAVVLTSDCYRYVVR